MCVVFQENENERGKFSNVYKNENWFFFIYLKKNEKSNKKIKIIFVFIKKKIPLYTFPQFSRVLYVYVCVFVIFFFLTFFLLLFLFGENNIDSAQFSIESTCFLFHSILFPIFPVFFLQNFSFFEFFAKVFFAIFIFSAFGKISLFE